MGEAKRIKLVIADDHEIYREGLRFLVSREKNIEIVGEATNGRDLLIYVEQQQPHVVITDLIMPLISGLEAIKQMITRFPTVRIIALSSFDNEELIIEALELGALGYIIKNAPKGEIVNAIRMVNEGRPYYCMSTSDAFASKMTDSSFDSYKNKQVACLTEMEKKMIVFLCEEKKNQEIAKLTGINMRTLERMQLKILGKIGVKSLAGLVIYAIKHGIYPQPY